MRFILLRFFRVPFQFLHTKPATQGVWLLSLSRLNPKLQLLTKKDLSLADCYRGEITQHGQSFSKEKPMGIYEVSYGAYRWHEWLPDSLAWGQEARYLKIKECKMCFVNVCHQSVVTCYFSWIGNHTIFWFSMFLYCRSRQFPKSFSPITRSCHKFSYILTCILYSLLGGFCSYHPWSSLSHAFVLNAHQSMC